MATQSVRATESRNNSKALSRATSGLSMSNYPTIYGGFMAKGIPESEIKPRENVFTYNAWRALAWIIHDFTGEKRKDALKEVMNTGFWRTQHSLSEHPRDDILLYTTAVLFLLPTPTRSG